MGYSFRLAAKGILYAPPHRQNNTYHSLCYTSNGVMFSTKDVVETFLIVSIFLQYFCVTSKLIYSFFAYEN